MRDLEVGDPIFNKDGFYGVVDYGPEGCYGFVTVALDNPGDQPSHRVIHVDQLHEALVLVEG